MASGGAGKWREEQVLVICPGSQTTMAQMGVAELTPPAYRFPTRMFRDDDGDGWRPYHTYRRKKASLANGGSALAGDNVPRADVDDDFEWVEDPDSVEGAVYPIRGEICPCFHAVLPTVEVESTSIALRAYGLRILIGTDEFHIDS